jgi:hypothetical protein
MSRRKSGPQPTAARIVFLIELDRLLQQFPTRWSRSTLRAAVILCEEHRAPTVFALLDHLEAVLTPPPSPSTPPAA